MGDARVESDDLLDGLVQKVGDGLDLFVVDPDETRRSRATMAALSAMKT